MATIRLEKFTNRELQKIPLPKKGITYVYPNEPRPKLGVTITKGGARIFHIKVNRKGYTERISIPNGELSLMTVSEARKVAPKLISDALEGNAPGEVKQRQKKAREANRRELITLSALFDEYVEKQKKKLDKPMKQATANDYKMRLKLSFGDYMAKPANVIDSGVVEQIMEDRGKSCLSALRVLKAVFNFGIKKNLDLVNPVPGKLASYGRKQTYLKAAYFPDWFKAVDKLQPDAKDYFLFLLFTGVRADTEASALSWDRIDWKSKSFKLVNTKNQKDVELPLPGYLIPMLKKRKQKEGFVFPGGEYRSAREQVIKEIDFHFTRHDLRRTFMTVAEGIDVSWLAVKRLSNHISQEHGVTEGYVVVNLERLQKASKLIESEILRLANR